MILTRLNLKKHQKKNLTLSCEDRHKAEKTSCFLATEKLMLNIRDIRLRHSHMTAVVIAYRQIV